MAALWHALEQGEATVQSAWQNRRTMAQQAHRMKEEVIGVVRRVITKDTASEDLYNQCFPDEVLVERYRAQRQQKAKAEERLRVQKERRDKARMLRLKEEEQRLNAEARKRVNGLEAIITRRHSRRAVPPI